MTYYDSISAGYNELHNAEQEAKVRTILSQLGKIEGLLDVGCGTGKAIAQVKCRKIGIDPSFELLKQASFPVVQGIGEALPFKDDSFDTVLCVTALHNFDNPKKGLEEMKRVGRKQFAITVLKKAKEYKKLCSLIKDQFTCSEVDNKHDTIFVCNK